MEIAQAPSLWCNWNTWGHGCPAEGQLRHLCTLDNSQPLAGARRMTTFITSLRPPLHLSGKPFAFCPADSFPRGVLSNAVSCLLVLKVMAGE